MAALLGWCMVLVVLSCLARWCLPALRPPGHHRDLVAWHAAMAAAMAAMFLVPLGRAPSVAASAVFAVGIGWSLIRIGRRVSRRAYLRLGVGCAAMSVMLLPATAAPAGAVDPHQAGHDHGSHALSDPGSTASAWWPEPASVVMLVLLVVVGVVLVVSAVRLVARSGPVALRVDACGEALMALAMGYMLLLMV